MAPTVAPTHAADDPWWHHVLTLQADGNNSTSTVTSGQHSTDLVKHPASAAATSIHHRSSSNSTGTPSNHQLRNGIEQQDINTTPGDIASPKTQPQHDQSSTPCGLRVATHSLYISSIERTLVTAATLAVTTHAPEQMQSLRLIQSLHIDDPSLSQRAEVIYSSLIINENLPHRKARLVAGSNASSALVTNNDITMHIQNVISIAVTVHTTNEQTFVTTFVNLDSLHQHSIEYAIVKDPCTREVAQISDPDQFQVASKMNNKEQVEEQPYNHQVFPQSNKYSAIPNPICLLLDNNSSHSTCNRHIDIHLLLMKETLQQLSFTVKRSPTALVQTHTSIPVRRHMH
jgi:hypothetical protein